MSHSELNTTNREDVNMSQDVSPVASPEFGDLGANHGQPTQFGQFDATAGENERPVPSEPGTSGANVIDRQLEDTQHPGVGEGAVEHQEGSAIYPSTKAMPSVPYATVGDIARKLPVVSLPHYMVSEVGCAKSEVRFNRRRPTKVIPVYEAGRLRSGRKFGSTILPPRAGKNPQARVEDWVTKTAEKDADPLPPDMDAEPLDEQEPNPVGTPVDTQDEREDTASEHAESYHSRRSRQSSSKKGSHRYGFPRIGGTARSQTSTIRSSLTSLTRTTSQHEDPAVLDKLLSTGKELGHATARAELADQRVDYVQKNAAVEAEAARKTAAIEAEAARRTAAAETEAAKKTAEAELAKKDAEYRLALATQEAAAKKKETEFQLTCSRNETEAKEKEKLAMLDKVLQMKEKEQELAAAKFQMAALEKDKQHLEDLARLREEAAKQNQSSAATQADRDALLKEEKLRLVEAKYELSDMQAQKDQLASLSNKLQKELNVKHLEFLSASSERDAALEKASRVAAEAHQRYEREKLHRLSQLKQNKQQLVPAEQEVFQVWNKQEQQRSKSLPRTSGETGVLTLDNRVPVQHRYVNPAWASDNDTAGDRAAVLVEPTREQGRLSPVVEGQLESPTKKKSSSKESSILKMGDDAGTYNKSETRSRRSQAEEPEKVIMPVAAFSDLLNVLNKARPQEGRSVSGASEIRDSRGATTAVIETHALLPDQSSRKKELGGNARFGYGGPTLVTPPADHGQKKEFCVQMTELRQEIAQEFRKMSEKQHEIAKEVESLKSYRGSQGSSPVKHPPAKGTSTTGNEVPARREVKAEVAEKLLQQLRELIGQQEAKGGSPVKTTPPSIVVNTSCGEEESVKKERLLAVAAVSARPPAGIVVNAQPVSINQIPEWSGSDTDIPFPEWLRRFERTLALSATTNTPEAKATYLPLRLTGDAITIYEAQPEHVRSNYDLIKAAISNRFCRTDGNQNPAWIKFEQKEGESVPRFATRLQRAQMDDLGEEVHNETNLRQLRRTFLDGLHREIHYKVVDNLPEEWDEVVKRARFVESLVNSRIRKARAASVDARAEEYYIDECEDECAAVEEGDDDLKRAGAAFIKHLSERRTTRDFGSHPMDAAAEGISDFLDVTGTGKRDWRDRGRTGGSSRGRGRGWSGRPPSRADTGDWRDRSKDSGSIPKSITYERSLPSLTDGRAFPIKEKDNEWSKDGPICRYCKDVGHYKMNCPRWCKKVEDYNEELVRRKSGNKDGTGKVTVVGPTQEEEVLMEQEWLEPVREASGVPRLPKRYRKRRHYFGPSLATISEDGTEPPIDEVETTAGIDTVASVKSTLTTSRMYVKVGVNDTFMIALVDTGATISIISEKIAKKCIPKEKIVKTDKECQSATDHVIPMLGKALVTLKIGDKEYEHQLYIAKGFSHELLLGDDWMVKAECSLVYRGKKRTMIIDGQQVKTRTGLVSEDVQAAYQISLIDRLMVPARTMTSMCFDMPQAEKGKDAEMEEGQLVYVQPMLRDDFESDVILPKCITRIKEGKLMVPVMNVSPTPAALPAGAYLMQVETCEPDIQSIQEIDMPELKSKNEQKHKECLERLKAKIKEWTAAGIPPPEVSGISFKESDLTEEQKSMFSFALSTVQDAFAKDDLELGMTHQVEHDIDTGSAPPIRQQPYRVPFQYRAEMEVMLREMIEQGVIEPSHSPWASPVVLVKKKDGKLRFCVDFRKINAVTRKDSYPLPRIDELLDSLNLAKYFTSIDLQSGFWQIPMTKHARSKTAFTCHMGLFEFRKMPFGLTSAPATFQRLMDCVLSGLTGYICLVFLDDVIIYTKTTVEQHMYDLLRVLQTLIAAGLKVKGRKCKVARKVLQFLGHLVSAEGIAPDPEKVKAIVECDPPKNVHEVRVFLGMVGFYRKFIESCAKICAAISKLLQKGVPFLWTKKCQIAFECLKKLLSTAPILGYPDLLKPFVLYTDASGVGLGSVLAQMGDDGREHVIAFASRTLRGYEVKYGITELEMLAIVWSMGHFRPYLLGTDTKIITDHKANHWILEKKKPKCAVSMRLTRWAILLQEYDYTVEYRPGRKLRNADALSRPPIVKHSKDLKDFDFDPETWKDREEDEGTGELGLKVTRREPNPIVQQYDEVTATEPAQVGGAANKVGPHEVAVLESFVMQSATNEQIRAEQLADPTLYAMIKWMEDKEIPDEDKLAIYVTRAAPWHSISDGVLFHIVKRKKPREPDPPYEPTEQLVVPQHMTEALMASYHSGKLAGHLGHDKLFHTIARKYYWKNCYDEIREHCKDCIRCAEFNRGCRRKARLYPTEVTEPFYRVFVDFEGELPETERGNKYILVFICSFTKFPICVAVKDCTAETAANAFINHVVLEHGCPIEVLSDQGPHFTAELYRRVCEVLGIKKTFSTPYHSQTLGQVENMNKTLLSMLRKTLVNEDDKWDLQLPYVVFAYRSTVHSSTKDSPFHAVYGRDPIHPHDLLVMPEIPADEDACAREIQQRMVRAWTSVREHLFVAKDKMAEYYNRNVVADRVKIGDNVVKQIPVLKGRNRKFVPTFESMYRVIAMEPPNITIQKWGEPITKKQVVHENLVKVYKGQWLEPPDHPAARRQVKARKAFLKKKFNCSKCFKRTVEGRDDETISWIQCDYCHGWFHWSCVGIKRRPRKLHWFCADCKTKGVIREGDPLDGYEPEEEGENLAEEDDQEEREPNRPGTSGTKRRRHVIRKKGGPVESETDTDEPEVDGEESDSSATTLDD